jgi:hypothetical protein
LGGIGNGINCGDWMVVWCSCLKMVVIEALRSELDSDG